MTPKLLLIAALMAALPALTGCAPLVVGAAGALAADEIMEQENGGDGLF